MAGLYNDAPSRRMAWDDDGTVCVYYTQSGNPLIDLSDANMALANDENDNQIISGSNSTNHRFHWLFPEKREYDGVFIAVWAFPNPSDATTNDSSVDTTNGIDGTWVQQIADVALLTNTPTKFRDNITSLAVAGVKGIRQQYNNTGQTHGPLGTVHIYGTISPAETPDRILFLDTLAADAVFAKVLDFGEVPRGQTQTRTFKIKNNSSTYTINTISITAEDLYLNAGGWYEFGIDDITYAATYAAGNLGTGASLEIYMKQIIPDAETLGLQTARIKVSHASLT